MTDTEILVEARRLSSEARRQRGEARKHERLSAQASLLANELQTQAKRLFNSLDMTEPERQDWQTTSDAWSNEMEGR